ncbi:MAG: DUF4404 family protein, partial [Steroidobacteraceae bacterium]
MSEETLRELLARVHERLGTSGALDRESRELLATVMRDIERALSGGMPAGAGPVSVPRLESLAVRFEAGH